MITGNPSLWRLVVSCIVSLVPYSPPNPPPPHPTHLMKDSGTLWVKFKNKIWVLVKHLGSKNKIPPPPPPPHPSHLMKTQGILCFKIRNWIWLTICNWILILVKHPSPQKSTCSPYTDIVYIQWFHFELQSNIFWPRRPWPIAGRKKQKNGRKITFFS